MAISLPLKLGISGLTAGVVGTGGFYGYRFLQNKDEEVTVSKKLKGFLMSAEGNVDQSKWEARKTFLSSVGEVTLVDDLKDIKTRSIPALNWTHIRNWCKDQHSKVVEGLDKKRSDNINTYCTYRVEEKLSKGKLDTSKLKTDPVWTGAFNKLNQLDDGKLSQLMKDIKAKGSNDNAGAEALRTMCSVAFSEPFRNDSKFKDVDNYCTDNA